MDIRGSIISIVGFFIFFISLEFLLYVYFIPDASLGTCAVILRLWRSPALGIDTYHASGHPLIREETNCPITSGVDRNPRSLRPPYTPLLRVFVTDGGDGTSGPTQVSNDNNTAVHLKLLLRTLWRYDKRRLA